MNVVDSLVVTVGLDASAFDKGQKSASDAFKKTRDDAVKHGKDIEESGNKSAESFRNVTREVATFLAKLASAKALYDFLTALQQINAATDRMAQSLGTSPESLSTFGQAVEKFGGNANEAAASLQHLLDAFNELRTTGNTSILPWLAQLSSRGGVKLDFQKPLTQQLLGVAENLKNVAARDPALAMFLGRRLGLDDSTIRLLMQGRQAVAQELVSTRSLAITREQSEAAVRLSRAWVETLQSIKAAGRELLTLVTPLLEKVLQFLKWMADGWRHFGIAARTALGDMLDAIRASGPGILDAFKRAFWGAFDWLKNEFNSIWRKITGSNLFDMSAHAAEAPGGGAGPLAGGAAGGASPGGHPGSTRGGAAEAGDAGGGATVGGATHARGNLAKNQQEAYAAARAEGLSDAAARALVANMSGESLKNPADYHWDRKHYSQGIVQWDPQRSEAIKRQFGKHPKDMTVAEQTRAAIWEINTSRRFARTRQALQGSDQNQMIRALVENYEAPLDARGAIAARTGYLRGLPKSFGAASAANINNSRSSSVVNNSSAQTSIGNVVVNTPATDGHGIARDLQNAITHHSFAAHLNYGGV